LEQAIEQCAVADLADHQGHLQNIAHDGGMTIDEVVKHDRLMTCPAQRPDSMTTDVASPASDKNPHRRLSEPVCPQAM
jgi:hypothetical protein